MASRFVTRTMSPPGGMQHSWHADDDGGDGDEPRIDDLPPSPPQPPQQHQQFPFQPPSPAFPSQHQPQHEQEDESYLPPPQHHPPRTPPPARSRWADSSSPPAHSNRSSAFDPDNVMSSDDGAEPYEDEQQQEQQHPPQLYQQEQPSQFDLPSPVPSYLPPFPPATKSAVGAHEEHKEMAEERYAASSFEERPRGDYAAPHRVAPSARAPAVSRLIAGEERESADLSDGLDDGWDAEEVEGEYSSAPQATQQRIRRTAPSSALEASSEAAAALFANPHVQSALSAAQSGLAYTRSTLESGMDLAGQRSSEFMEKVMPVIMATAQSAAAVSAETLSASVMPSVSAAVHSTYEQVSMSVVPGVVQQAKAVQRWLAQRVHLSTPVHPAQLMSAGSSSTGAADAGKEDLSSYIAYIEAALRKSEEQDEQASRVLEQQQGSPGGSAASAGSAAADSNASYLSGQSVLVIEDHFDKITEKEKTKLTMFLAEMKRVRNQQQQQQQQTLSAGNERARGNSVDLKQQTAPSSQQQHQSPQLQSSPPQHQHRRDDSSEGERKSAQPPQQQQHQHPRSQAPPSSSSSSRHSKSSSRRPSSQQQSSQPQHRQHPPPPHPFPDLLSAPFPPTDLSSDASAEPLADPFSDPALAFDVADVSSRSARVQHQQPQSQPHDRRDSFPDLLSAPFAPSVNLPLPSHPELDSPPNSVFNQRWPDGPEELPMEPTQPQQPAHLHPSSIFSAISHPQHPQLQHQQSTHTHRQHRQPPPPPSHHMQAEADDRAEDD